MSVTTIESDQLISPEEHFRISAGPGAGKTYWLVLHLKNLLQKSSRLGNNKKIACITYTNIAVDTILKRLDFIADRVDVSTIHGFLYSNIIKPYMSFIAAEFDFNAKRMDGHEDHFPSRSKIKEWIENHPNKAKFAHPYSLNQLTKIEHYLQGVGNWLSSIRYEIASGDIVMTTDNTKAFYYDDTGKRINLGNTTCLDKLFPGLLEYKKIFWKKGILHHDDVLYFSFILLKRFPFIITVLRAKYPYFFIDEFQDTSPVQAHILNTVGQAETIIGIIGDKAQSIYSFQGASPKHFTDFNLTGLKDYQILNNRRSTNKIVNVLNHIRTDIKQIPVRNVAGDPPVIFVGDMNWAFSEAQKLNPDQLITTLSRDNITSNAMKRHLTSELPSKDLIVELLAKDSNSDRRLVILSCINAVEIAKQKRFKEAIKEMERNFFSFTDKNERKKTAFAKLSLLLARYDSYKTGKLVDFHGLVRAEVKTDIAKFAKGAISDFYNNNTYEQLAVSVKIAEDNSPNRTIHKAKGDEFDNVLLILKKDKELSFLLNPDLAAEEQRIMYVGASRSKERLYITVPEISPADEAKLNLLFDIKHMSKT